MTDEEILKKLKKYFMTNGKITIEDGLVSCTGDVTLVNAHKVTALPVKFKSVDGYFDCSSNKLTSLAGAPQAVGCGFDCTNNQLTTLEGAPQYLEYNFECINNPLTSLAGAPRYVGRFFYLAYDKNLPLLSLLQIKGCKQIIFSNGKTYTNKDLSAILNKYLGQGRPGMLPCANEMIKAGYGSNARL